MIETQLEALRSIRQTADSRHTRLIELLELSIAHQMVYGQVGTQSFGNVTTKFTIRPK